jgi:hypothetical protein
MKAVNQMTVKEIIESIEVMRNGLSLNPGEREKQILLKNIARAQDELKKREEQKKSAPQPTEKPEQLPDLEQRREQENKAAFFEEKKQAAQLHSESRPQERQPGLLEQVIKFVVPPPPPEQIIELEFEIGGKKVVENYEIMDLKDKARTWFTQTAEGAAIQGKGNLEKSIQYRRLHALIPNWESLYGFKPTAQDLHRNHNKHGEAVKSAAVRLLQILTK